MNKISRGSHQGLLKNREETKERNTEALWHQVQRLRKEKPDTLWSFKEVWQGAGLKSNVALDSPWNASIKEAISEHNRLLREKAESGSVGQAQRKTLRITNKELRNQIQQIKKEYEKALSKMAVWEAEADFYQRENERLQRKIERLLSAD
ncbi:hypothetical protein ACSEE7_18185 [Halomonas cupida]|uniref:hypothetical protein n=1 Tax=Halomonas cupida TaxID=44933 RepID=UPI001BCDCDBF|nr:hypothetical protein [Halomonas litopenaei]